MRNFGIGETLRVDKTAFGDISIPNMTEEPGFGQQTTQVQTAGQPDHTEWF